MSIGNFNKKMEKEIKKKMESRAWNQEIASYVLQKKKKATKKIIYWSSLSPVAAAAVFILVFLFAVRPVKELPAYENFIAVQLEGTNRTAQNMPIESTKENKKTDDILLGNDIDTFIDNTLAIR